MTIHYQKMGSGPALIMIHGLFGTLDNLKSLAKKLSTDFEVYLIDAPAHGNSSTTTPLNIETMAKQVIEFISSEDLPNVRLLGHSLGGKIAMEIALLEPNLVSQLIVADIAPVTYPRRHDNIIAGLQAVTHNETDRKMADAILRQYIEEPGIRSFLLKSFVNKVDRVWAFDIDSLSKYYPALIAGNRVATSAVDTLFIIGGKSNYVTQDHKNDIVTRFPNSSHKVILDAGHWLHAEKPTAFEKICRDFLVVS